MRGFVHYLVTGGVPLVVLFMALWLILYFFRLSRPPGPPPFKPGEEVEYRRETPLTDEEARCPVHVVGCEWSARKGEWEVRLAFTFAKDSTWEATAPASRVHHLDIVRRLAELA